MQCFDAIVVGAGSAGCAVAARLAMADPKNRVLLIEAGGTANRLLVQVPAAWPIASTKSAFGWNYRSEPEAAIGGRSIEQPRGRLMGGTSSINGMMYSRGNAADYDGWAAMGLDGWSHADLLPLFRRSERNWRGANPWHGGDGPVSVVSNPRNPLLYPAMVATAAELGIAENPDFNGASQAGVGMPDFTVRGGRRESSATAYLAMAGSRVTVWKNSRVTRIILDGTRVAGVQVARGGVPETVHAAETILCGGALNSPHLLMLSGIGDPAVLRAAGVPPRVALPAVGRNLQDHPMVAAVYAAARPLGFESRLRLDRLAASAAGWLAGRGGLLSDAPLAGQAYVALNGPADWPDMQFQLSYGSMLSRPWFTGWRGPSPDMLVAAGLQLRPEGRGSVRLVSADPFRAPAIRLGLLEHAADRAFARDMLGFIRRFLATGPLRDLVRAEVSPGADADIDASLSAQILTGQHQAGTCAMGTDPETSVVDAALRPHGLSGIRIADTSIMPRIVSGNTSAPAMMIGEKAADLILGNAAPASSQGLRNGSE